MTQANYNQIIESLEGMIQRRVDNTGESRQQAMSHIKNYLLKYTASIEQQESK